MANESIIESIIAFLFGHKYYATVAYRRGCAADQFINSEIFLTKEGAKAHADTLIDNSSFGYVETISFRSRKEYRPYVLRKTLPQE